MWAPQLLCSLVEERGCGHPRLNSRSDDIYCRPTQLLSGALAPPRRGRPGLPACLPVNTTSLPSISPPRNWALTHISELRSASQQLSQGHRRLCALLSLWGQMGPQKPSPSPASDLALPLAPAPWGLGGGRSSRLQADFKVDREKPVGAHTSRAPQPAPQKGSQPGNSLDPCLF